MLESELTLVDDCRILEGRATVVAKRTQRLHGVWDWATKDQGREFLFARRQHVQRRYARCCHPAGV